MSFAEHLAALGVLRPGARVLDIGAQNLYLATADAITTFVEKMGRSCSPEWAQQLAAGSGHTECGQGFVNGAFLYDLLERSGMSYTAFDIFAGQRIRVFDLNENRVPLLMRGTFDVVLNFGTTEHVANQCNAFRVIHDAAKPGGFIFHQVPCTGHFEHGFFCYSPKFFALMAEANRYTVAAQWLSGPMDNLPLLGNVRFLPHLFEDQNHPDNDLTGLYAVRVPGTILNVLLRKTIKGKFRLPLDTSTTIGRVAEKIDRRYAPPPEGDTDATNDSDSP